MVADVKKLIGSDIQDIVKSAELSLLLLKVYSKLYLHGGQPGVCIKCQTNYHNQLKKNGMAKAQLLAKVKVSKCVAKWNGLKYIPKTCSHLDSKLIYDEQAIEMLNKGHLKESDFNILPEGYMATKAAHKIADAEEELSSFNFEKPNYKTMRGLVKVLGIEVKNYERETLVTALQRYLGSKKD